MHSLAKGSLSADLHSCCHHIRLLWISLTVQKCPLYIFNGVMLIGALIVWKGCRLTYFLGIHRYSRHILWIIILRRKSCILGIIYASLWLLLRSCALKVISSTILVLGLYTIRRFTRHLIMHICEHKNPWGLIRLTTYWCSFKLFASQSFLLHFHLIHLVLVFAWHHNLICFLDHYASLLLVW